MRRGKVFVVGFLLVLLFINCFVLAQGDAEVSVEKNGTDGDVPEVVDNEDDVKPELGDVKQGLGEVGEGLKGAGEKFETALEKDIIIPENLRIPARILFGLKSEHELNFQILVVLIALWIFVFLIAHNILEITPFFEGWKSWITALIVTCIIAITGAINSFAIFFFNLGNIFSVLEKWSILKLFFSIIIIGVLFFVFSFISKIIKNKMQLEKAEREGMDVGAQVAKFKAMGEIEKELGS